MGLAWLFLDLNAYFASVEQQLDPGLRGRPVVVAPVNAKSTCCIAVSYEAKARGVKTGMIVAEAERRCPELSVQVAQPKVYVEFHHRVIAAVETCLPVSKVCSIDEMCCRLSRRETDPTEAVRLAQRVKAAIRREVGECLRCSIGLAPNRFLAKVGTDMQKPDGLVVLQEHDLPHALFNLGLTDLPGIGSRMHTRLLAERVATVEALCALSEREMERIWGGVVGRRWWRWLRGMEAEEPPTRRSSISHQHVLPPERRTDAGAWEVAVRLLHKAVARTRHLGYWPRRLTLSVQTADKKTWWASRYFDGGTQDTLALLETMSRMWTERPRGRPLWIDVTLHDFLSAASRTLPLFETERRREDLSRAIDRLNGRYGPHTVFAASMQKARKSAPGGIAFNSIPDPELPDSVAWDGARR